MVKNVGIKMWMYKRYVDDSNQAAEVPPVGYKYETNKGLFYDSNEAELRVGEKDDTRLARILGDIANNVTVGIEMVADFPSNNNDNKMAILDTKE